MDFTRGTIKGESDLFILQVEGREFFQETSPTTTYPQKTQFIVKQHTEDVHIEYPSYYSRKHYEEKYGPYSIEVFTKKVYAIYTSFHDAEVMKDDQRMFVRKMWVFKELFETFEKSMELILVRLSKMVPSIYQRALIIMEIAETRQKECDARANKYVEMSLVVVRRVFAKLVEILVEPRFLKLMPPELLERFVKDASPFMVAKIKCLPWIEPEIVLLAESKYNIYWTLLWHPFFTRNFKLSSDICYEIAEYMPVNLCGETFLDYFRRKYNATKGYFHDEDAFKINRKVMLQGGYYWNSITIVL